MLQSKCEQVLIFQPSNVERAHLKLESTTKGRSRHTDLVSVLVHHKGITIVLSLFKSHWSALISVFVNRYTRTEP